MTQEVQITLTLEVDITQQRIDIHDYISLLMLRNCKEPYEFIQIDSIKEEAEIYDTED